MDEVWILSLCLTLLAFLILILSLKSKAEPEPKSDSKVSTPSASFSYGGKRLECSEEEVEKMMERMTHLLFEPDIGKKEVAQEKRKAAPQERADERTPHRRDAENTNETQELLGKQPMHTQPASQLSHHRVQERSAPAAGVGNIMDEIEQAVQETVEPDYYTRRRQHQAGSRGRQWSELTDRTERDSM
ncbi:hypothetical protein XELAEV_18047675mg [Xenopus laevis]|uniref:Uncharacterized protein n=1 Tax=Xenopus laevis TaxID=8355 RepID=A0A974BVB0_XENLA|nr:hypothetical protein XELAEV_18047675mg [Xenopus laevis]